jgi:uncharacterized protein YjaZ
MSVKLHILNASGYLKDVERRAGYSLGYHLVKTYCERQRVSASKLYDVTAKTILEG